MAINFDSSPTFPVRVQEHTVGTCNQQNQPPAHSHHHRC